jgi:hypothetical protein
MADDRTRDVLDHLQVAALEMIAAFRALLDVAEEAVRQPEALRDLLATTARVAAQATQATQAAQARSAQARSAQPGPTAATAPTGSAPGAETGAERRRGVEHISIS